jgi:hypothetical protein
MHGQPHIRFSLRLVLMHQPVLKIPEEKTMLRLLELKIFTYFDNLFSFIENLLDHGE